MNNKKTILAVIIALVIGAVVGAVIFAPRAPGTPSSSQEPTGKEAAATDEEITTEPKEDTSDTPTEKEYTPPTKKTETTPKSGTENLPLVTKDGIYLIYYTSDGFEPSTLVIPKGTSVRFINMSDRAMKVFAEDYLENSYWADLNQSKTAAKGDYYSFTFLRTGECGYYNNFGKEHTGTIIIY